MDKIPSKEEFENLSNKYCEMKKEYDLIKTNSNNQPMQISQSDDFLAKVLEKGVEAYSIWSKGQLELDRYSIDKNHEIELHKLKYAKDANSSNNITKTIIVVAALGVAFTLGYLGKLDTGIITLCTAVAVSAFSKGVADAFKYIHNAIRKDDDD